MADWKITYGVDGEGIIAFTEADLTDGDLCVADMLTGGGWTKDPTAGPHYAAALLAAYVARITDSYPLEVLAEIHARPAGSLRRSLQIVTSSET